MEQLLEDLAEELRSINNLIKTLDNAMLHCNDSGLDTYHLQTLTDYASKRLNKFVTSFENAEFEYYQKHVLPNTTFK